VSASELSLPRRRPRALLLDRDGTLISETGYLRAGEPYAWLPGAADALARACAGGLGLAVVTNQSAIARGWLTREGLDGIHGRMRAELAAHGVTLEHWLACPHHPDFDPGAGGACACRKPEPGLLLKAARLLGVAPGDCWMVGDSWRDLEAGRRAGCTPVLVTTGKGASQWSLALGTDGAPPLTAPDLGAVVDWALGLPH
jgi:D-glycero-D-manno-heptose 1,7-bisphosphate phosphatase